MTLTPATRRAIVTGATAVLLAVTLPALSLAQRGGGGRGGGGGDGMQAPAFQPSRLESLERDFALTKDQKKTVKSILDDAHANAAPIRDGLVRTRAAVAAVIQAGGTQAEIDAAVGGYAEQAAAMTVLEMQAFARVLQALEPDQQANVDGGRAAFYLMRGMFLDSKKWNVVPDSRLY